MTIATLFPSRQELPVVNRVSGLRAFLAPLVDSGGVGSSSVIRR